MPDDVEVVIKIDKDTYNNFICNEYSRVDVIAIHTALVNGTPLETVTEFADRCRECGAKYGRLLKQESMRDATPEERESVNAYIKRISKPTGIEFDEVRRESRKADQENEEEVSD